MTELQSHKLPLFSRIRGIWRNRSPREDGVKDELDNSHRSSRHTVNLDEISTASKITSQEFLDTSSQRQMCENGGSETVNSPVRIEEVSESEEEAEPDERLQILKPFVAPLTSHSERHVHFSTVSVREYPICMGTNPGSSRGIPITMGWEVVEEKNCNVDEYQNRPRAAHLHQFRMAPLDRVLMLKRLGYSGQQIKEGADLVDEFRAQRRRTSSTLHFSRLHEFLERLQRSILNGTIRKSRKRKEREFLRQYKSKSPTSFEAVKTTFRAPPTLRDSIISRGNNVYLQ